ncbi:EamA family transporter [Marimonas sp. MJW-29]|uniref:EamA family transporter n=1 Tax=Sulfitobacter sediminis TaxID=3234186 RepID=A0ABV3RGG0_9RHOB
MPLFIGLAFTLLTSAVVIYGDYLIKVAADDGHPMISPLVLLGCVLYAFSAILWFFALRHVTLSQAGVAFSMLTLLALCAIGVFHFGEKLEWREVAGIGCALLAMVLMMRIA